MQAALLYGKEDIRLESYDLPPLLGGDLLLRIRSCGICGSDNRMFFNGPSARYIHPVILGHEICAEVAQVGSEVEGYAPGDLVGLAPIIPCMHCLPCASGQDNICETAKVIGCNVHGDLVRLMKRAGCYTVFIGFESVNPESLAEMKKGQNLEDIRKAIDTRPKTTGPSPSRKPTPSNEPEKTIQPPTVIDFPKPPDSDQHD